MAAIVWELDSYHLESCTIDDEVYSIQHYVVKFVSDLVQVGYFLHL
jgi:hypothetical protein